MKKKERNKNGDFSNTILRVDACRERRPRVVKKPNRTIQEAIDAAIAEVYGKDAGLAR